LSHGGLRLLDRDKASRLAPSMVVGLDATKSPHINWLNPKPRVHERRVGHFTFHEDLTARQGAARSVRCRLCRQNADCCQRLRISRGGRCHYLGVYLFKLAWYLDKESLRIAGAMKAIPSEIKLRANRSQIDC
jgi:hypothetical protein